MRLLKHGIQFIMKELIYMIMMKKEALDIIVFIRLRLDTQDHAWNLPMVKATLLAKYNRKKWSAGADLFFASNRKDELSVIPSSTTRITNASYIDLNLHGLYRITDKFDAFLNVNNILNDNYQEYTNFRVQGFQFLLGMKFKFDLE